MNYLVADPNNAATNACLVQPTNTNNQFRKPLASSPTSNGGRHPRDAAVIEENFMVNYKEKLLASIAQHLQQYILEQCANTCVKT